MFSKREIEGYVLIDHKQSPGLPPETVQNTALAGLPVGAGQRFEGITYTCSHCERQIVLEIKNRDKSPGYCYGCDRNLCKRCALVYKLTGVCRPFKKVIDEIKERGLRGA